MMPRTSPMASTSECPLNSRRIACDAVRAASDSSNSSQPRGARVEVDRRENAPIGKLAAQNQFAVTGPLEFLEDHLVHAGTRVTSAVAMIVREPPPCAGSM